MSKKKYEMVPKSYMPRESKETIIDNIQNPSRFFVTTPDITNLGYDVIEWLHTNPKTKDMTNAEWSAILGIALFNLGFDTANGERYSVKGDVVNKRTEDSSKMYSSRDISELADNILKLARGNKG